MRSARVTGRDQPGPSPTDFRSLARSTHRTRGRTSETPWPPPQTINPREEKCIWTTGLRGRSAASASRGCWGRVTGISPRPVGNSPSIEHHHLGAVGSGRWGTAEETSGVEEDSKS